MGPETSSRAPGSRGLPGTSGGHRTGPERARIQAGFSLFFFFKKKLEQDSTLWSCTFQVRKLYHVR